MLGNWGDMLYVLKQFGPLVLVTAFLLWQSWSREKRMSDRITKLENEQREVIMPLVANNAEVIGQNTLMFGRLEEALRYRADCPFLRQQLTASQISHEAKL